MPADSRLKLGDFDAERAQPALQERRHEQQRKVAVHNSRHGGEQFERRFDRLACAGASEFGKIDRHQQAQWHSYGERDQSGHERPGQKRRDAVLGIVEQRRPSCRGQKLDSRNLGEELRRFGNDDVDDAQDDRDRRRGGGEQQPLHHTLAPAKLLLGEVPFQRPPLDPDSAHVLRASARIVEVGARGNAPRPTPLQSISR